VAECIVAAGGKVALLDVNDTAGNVDAVRALGDPRPAFTRST
jgi:hypothetical protein